MRPFLLSWALLASVISLLQPSPPAFMLGVLRRDALIVPIATYDGKRWENDWPLPDANIDIPISLSSVPRRWWGSAGAQETWQVWTPAASPQLVHVRQPDWAPAYCQKQVGLRTDYQPRLRPPGAGTQPFPIDGLAVFPPQPVELVDVLPLDSSERGAVAEAIHQTFAGQESAAFRQWRSARVSNRRLPAVPTAQDLVAVPTMSIEALYANGSTRRTYFFEAAREYKIAGECTAVGFGAGWVTRDQGRFSAVSLRFSVSACDRHELSYTLPVGVLSLPTGKYWIAQVAGWNHVTYDIFDVTSPATTSVRSTPGGGC